MSKHDYDVGRNIVADVDGLTFASLIMAAMREADSDNLWALQRAFPEIWSELEKRYNAPSGFLPGDPFGPPVDMPHPSGNGELVTVTSVEEFYAWADEYRTRMGP